MKRFLGLLVVVFFPLHSSFAQMIVADAAVAGLLQSTHAENLIRYIQMIDEAKNQVIHLKQQLEHAATQSAIAIKNMQGLKNVDSWDDFMNWYNRQLYYERRTIESVKGMNVSIGKKNYSLYDLEGIRDGLKDEYIDYWDKEFTEEQRREMWLGLGLSPSNYAYVQPYRVKGRELARQFIAMSQIQNERNLKNTEEYKKDRDAILLDDSLPEDKQMGDKELQQRILLATNRNGEALGDIAAMTAKQLEMQGIDKALDAPLKEPQQVSNWDTGFERLKK